MSTSHVQNYANHAYTPRPTGLAGGFALVAFVILAIALVRNPTLVNVALVLLCCSIFVLVAISRSYTVRLQDRIIRLEMRLRLERMGRALDYDRLAHEQLIALRFASDDELPGLIERALGERLTLKQIKQAVKNWQPDLYRT